MIKDRSKYHRIATISESARWNAKVALRARSNAKIAARLRARSNARYYPRIASIANRRWGCRRTVKNATTVWRISLLGGALPASSVRVWASHFMPPAKTPNTSSLVDSSKTGLKLQVLKNNIINLKRLNLLFFWQMQTFFLDCYLSGIKTASTQVLLSFKHLDRQASRMSI